jgi:hypothetical protein
MQSALRHRQNEQFASNWPVELPIVALALTRQPPVHPNPAPAACFPLAGKNANEDGNEIGGLGGEFLCSSH